MILLIIENCIYRELLAEGSYSVSLIIYQFTKYVSIVFLYDINKHKMAMTFLY